MRMCACACVHAHCLEMCTQFGAVNKPSKYKWNGEITYDVYIFQIVYNIKTAENEENQLSPRGPFGSKTKSPL